MRTGSVNFLLRGMECDQVGWGGGCGGWGGGGCWVWGVGWWGVLGVGGVEWAGGGGEVGGNHMKPLDIPTGRGSYKN